MGRMKKWLIQKFNVVCDFICGRPLLNFSKHIGTIYVLNLASRKDRKEILSKRLESIKTWSGKTLLDYTIWVKAIPGKYLPTWNKNKVIADYDFMDHWQFQPDPSFIKDLEHFKKQKITATNIEVAIGTGHFNMWQQFKKSKFKSALFLEDDIYFKDEPRQFIQKFNQILLELPKDWDILYINAHRCEYGGFKTQPISENILRLDQGVWWLSGYMLSKEGVKKLLKNKPIVGPVDVWINKCLPKMNAYIVKEDPITQDQDQLSSDNSYSWNARFWPN